MKRAYSMSWLMLIVFTNLFGQNCKIISTSIDTVFHPKVMSNPIVFDYKNDSLLIVKFGTAYTTVRFSFEEFEKDERHLKNDTFIVRNGELLQNVFGEEVVVFSPSCFFNKSATYQYKFYDNSKLGYYEISKIKYLPMRKEIINGEVYFKYLSNTYTFITSSIDKNADSLKQNILRINERDFLLDEESDIFFHFVPGKGFLFDFCDDDLSLHTYFNQFASTSCCEEFINRKFATWR